MSKTAVVSLSAGLDCVTSLALAIHQGVEVKRAIFFDYGQKAAKKEKEASIAIANHYNIPNIEVIELPFLKSITKTALVNEEQSIPKPNANDLDKVLDMQQTASAVWVPNRNGLMVNILGCYADSFEYDQIIVGWNAEECTTFSDNTPQCAMAMIDSLSYTTQQAPEVISYVQNMNKMEIVRKAVQLNVPVDHLWSCYHGAEKMCGECESCKRFVRAWRATDNWDLVKSKFNDPVAVG